MRAPRSGLVAKAEPGPIEILRQENELLKATLGDQLAVVDKLDELVAHTSGTTSGQGLIPEDFWSPSLEVPEGHEFIEEHGAISTIPSHNGTECFKWDNQLWSQEAHFKVHGNLHGNLAWQPQRMHQYSVWIPSALIRMVLWYQIHRGSRPVAPAQP